MLFGTPLVPFLVPCILQSRHVDTYSDTAPHLQAMVLQWMVCRIYTEVFAVTLSLAVLLLVPCSYPVYIPEAQPRTHAVFVFDTHAHGVGAMVQRDRFNILKTFHGGFRDAGQEARLVWTELEGTAATPQNVIQHIAALQPGPADTVLIYYAGHGAVDATHGHFLKMRYGRLYRSTLQAALARHKVRLSVLITESCAVVEPGMHMAMKPGGPATGNWEMLSRLLFETKGKVDLNSCCPNQVAIAAPGTGAFFTHNLAAVLCRPPAQHEITWESVIDQTERNLWQIVPRNRQEAYTYALPGSGQPAAAPAQPQRTWTQSPYPTQQRGYPQ